MSPKSRNLSVDILCQLLKLENPDDFEKRRIKQNGKQKTHYIIEFKDLKYLIDNKPYYKFSERYRQTGKTTRKILETICEIYAGKNIYFCLNNAGMSRRTQSILESYLQILNSHFGRPTGSCKIITIGEAHYSMVGSTRTIIYDLH